MGTTCSPELRKHSKCILLLFFNQVTVAAVQTILGFKHFGYRVTNNFDVKSAQLSVNNVKIRNFIILLSLFFLSLIHNLTFTK